MGFQLLDAGDWNQSKLNERGCGISTNIVMPWRFVFSLVKRNVFCYFVGEALDRQIRAFNPQEHLKIELQNSQPYLDDTDCF